MASAERDPMDIFEEYIKLMKDDCLAPELRELKDELNNLGWCITEAQKSCRETATHIIWVKTFELWDTPDGEPKVTMPHVEIRIAKNRYNKPDPAKHILKMTDQDIKFLRSLKISVENII